MEAAIAALAAEARQEVATRTAHRLALEVEVLRTAGIITHQGLARALMERGVPTPRSSSAWTHTTVARVLDRLVNPKSEANDRSSDP